MRNAIKPGPERSWDLKRSQSAERVEPDFLVQIKGIISVWDETPQVIKERPFVAVQQTNERFRVTRLGFRNPDGFFESGKLLLGRVRRVRIHRLFKVSRSEATVQTFFHTFDAARPPSSIRAP